MKTLKSTFIIIFAIIALINIASAYQIQDIDKEMFPQNVSYDPNIPSPELFLGRKLGAPPVRQHELVEYLRMIANLSDRLTVETIGYSHERRPILFLVATSSSNQNNIEQIKNEHLNLSDSRKDQIVADKMPIVTWLNYGVHGAE